MIDLNQTYSQKELGAMAEALWTWCSFPQPQEGSFLMRAVEVVGDQVKLAGSLLDSVDGLSYSTICLVPLVKFKTFSWYGGTYCNHPVGGDGFKSYQEALADALKVSNLDWFEIKEGSCPFEKLIN